MTLRALPIVPLSLVSIVGGVIRVPFWIYMAWSCLGFVPRIYVLSIVGWQTGASALGLAKGVDRFESIVSALLVLVVIGSIIVLRQRVRRDMARGKE